MVMVIAYNYLSSLTNGVVFSFNNSSIKTGYTFIIACIHGGHDSSRTHKDDMKTISLKFWYLSKKISDVSKNCGGI